MATTFNLTTYPLDDSTSFRDIDGTRLTVFDDETVALQDTGNEAREIRCKFSPMSAADGQTLVAYLRTNKATEFDIVIEGITYRGYFYGPRDIKNFDGDFVTVSARFRGVAQ